VRNGDDTEHPAAGPALPAEADREPPTQPTTAVLRRRPWQRRKYQIAAAVGVAAVLGAGGLAVQLRQTGDSTTGSPLGARPQVSPTVDADRNDPAAPDADQPVDGPSAPPSAKPSVVPTVTTSGSLKRDRRTMRVITARGDLTGQRELAWAADEGRAVGNARCTQNFRFNPGASVGERPTMLLCWRTSSDRSVYTVAVDLDGRPSTSDSVAAIDKAWSKLD